MTEDIKADAENVMKRCQIGTKNYNEANNLHAECYGTIGRLLLQVETLSRCLFQMQEAAKIAIAEAEKQEPVAWLITDKNINHLQVESIQHLIDRARHAHMTDIKLRINGQDEWYEADWLKHMTRTSPPQRQWVGLTDEEIWNVLQFRGYNTDTIEIARAIEAKLKEKNT